MPLTSAEHRQAHSTAKALRNARARDRRRRGLPPVLSWERTPGGYRRCLVCGRWCSESQTAGRTGPLRFCEDCLVARELRLEARRLATGAGRAAA